MLQKQVDFTLKIPGRSDLDRSMELDQVYDHAINELSMSLTIPDYRFAHYAHSAEAYLQNLNAIRAVALGSFTAICDLKGVKFTLRNIFSSPIPSSLLAQSPVSSTRTQWRRGISDIVI